MEVYPLDHNSDITRQSSIAEPAEPIKSTKIVNKKRI